MVAPRAIRLLFLFLAADRVECFLSSRRHSLCHDRFALHAIVEDSAMAALVEEQSEVIPNTLEETAAFVLAKYSDLRSRKFFSGAQNDMFVARRVVAVSASSALILSSPPIVDMSIIYNREGLPKRPQDNDLEFIRGDVIGFCEVSERPFGLGKNFDEQSDDGGYRVRKRPIRPLLTNLSVRPDVRKSGLGSQLVRVCEDAVLQWDPAYDEIVLQVEEDNPLALQFYEKRGYASLFADPSCRRFDTSGIFLQQVRTTKICMRKSLRRGLIGNRNGNDTLGSFFSNGSSLFDKLRDSILKMSDL
eukprot:scaffold50392_cov52-Attheya_sp.AAC.3